MGQLRYKGLIILLLLSAIVGLTSCLGQTGVVAARTITVSPTNLTTSEDGSTATFTVSLNEAPAGNVVIDVVSTDASEVLVGNSVTGGFSPYLTLTFTPSDWVTPQTIAVQGVDDLDQDGNQNVTVTVNINTSLTRDTTGYLGVNPADVRVTNIDDDTAGVTVNPPGGLATSENGTTATFTVRLNTQPDSGVIIDVASLDLSEGTVAPAQLTFDDTNWSIPQTVTVSGQDDVIIDGNQAYAVRLTMNTSATGYAGIAPIDVSVTNIDNDRSGVTVNPPGGLATSENGTTATFTVVLNTQPDSDVTIDLASLDETEGTVAPAQFTFNTTYWSTPQTVTVTGVNDDLTDGNQTYAVRLTISTSATGYAGMDPIDVSVTNADNDAAGVTVNPPGGLATSEIGTTATFTVRLNTQPDSDVTIGVASLDETEGTVAPAQLTFDTTNWSTPQTVTVTGQDDFILDGNQTYAVRLTISTSATGYDAITPIDVSVTNIDNDTAGIIVIPTSGLITSEDGTTAIFTVRLNTQPLGEGENVTFDIASLDETEGTAAPAQLIFTQSDWQTPQTVTVTGQPDGLVDNDQVYIVAVDINTSGTAPATGYNKVNPVDVTATNTNID